MFLHAANNSKIRGEEAWQGGTMGGREEQWNMGRKEGGKEGNRLNVASIDLGLSRSHPC